MPKKCSVPPLLCLFMGVQHLSRAPPPAHTLIADGKSSSPSQIPHSNSQAIFFACIIFPYALLTLLAPTAAWLPIFLPLLLILFYLHLYSRPRLASYLFPSFSAESVDGHKEIGKAGNYQHVCLFTTGAWLMAVNVGEDSWPFISR
jgi:hypothetical protein